jgi:hypothetical protein
MFGGVHPLLAPITGWLLRIFWFPLALAGHYWLPRFPDYVLLLANSTLFGIVGSSLWRWWRRRGPRERGA